MRLEADEIAAIKAAALKVFGPDAEVRLFGSRVDDTLRGGDIDLHVTLPQTPTDWRSEYRFVDEICCAIGEQRIDVLVIGRSDPLRPIDETALAHGLVL